MRAGRGWWQALTAVALAILVWSAIGPVPAAIPGLYLAAVGPELTRIDLREKRLPNRIVLPGLVVGIAAAAGSWLTSGVPPLVPVVAGVAFGGGLFLIALAGGMGMGDVKLAALIGLASPTTPLAIGSPIVAFLTGGLVSVAVLLARGPRQHIAFGPFLILGYFTSLGVAALGP